ncbi:1-deoxy-D-xylulose-5-phosphate reductoisomerase [soil metagenome]
MKGVSILGATGSIGASALSVLERHPDRFRVVALTAHRNGPELERLVERWKPALAVLSDPAADLPRSAGVTRWASGPEALLEAASHPGADVVINALVGAAGLEPTLAALGAGKRLALANKESLVCGGPLVLEQAARSGGELIPVDSEHSAIFQCLGGSDASLVDRLILTASGGPFRSIPSDQLGRMRAEDALRHPTWSMGDKITIDSATLANKALEVIEAHFLFGIGYDRITAVVHPQSIIHSMVEFVDGSVLAQMGFPTMETPILYALSHPDRLVGAGRRFDAVSAGELTFETIREDAFPAFSLGVAAGRAGGTMPAVFNAANEVVVAAFLAGRIRFPEIASGIEQALSSWKGGDVDSLASVREADGWARRTVETFIENHAPC